MTFSQFLNLFSILGGGVVASVFVSYLTSRRDLKNYKRKKYEELYEIIRTDKVKFYDWWIRYQAAFEGSITLKDAQQGSTSIIDGAELKTKAEMLTSLYAPALIPPVQEYFRAKQSLVEVINEKVKERQSDSTPLKTMAVFHTARTNVDEAMEKLVAAIALQSSKL